MKKITLVILSIVLMLQYVAFAQDVKPELADFALAPIFTDHMVLQQNEKINVYGSAPDGAEVAVSIGGGRADGRADLII